MNKKINFAAFFLALLLHSLQVHAGEKEEEIIAKVTTAYGGKALTQAKGLRILDRFKLLYTDQGLKPNFTEINKQNIDFVIDLEKQRKSLITWESSGRGNRLTQTVFDGQKGRIYDLFNKTFNEAEYVKFETVGGGVERSHDTLLAYTAWENRKTAKYLGEIIHRDIYHHLLKVKQTNGPELILHISRQTGLISRMTRNIPNLGEIAYVFSNHTITDGVTHAKDYQLNIAGQPEIISISRDIEINPPLENHFSVHTNSHIKGNTIDSSKMTVSTVGEGVFLVGQGHAFSMFVDVGDDIIAVGGNGGFKQRYEAVKEAIGINKPLKYQIVTHHHSDHLEGMSDAAELGAIFVTVDEHISSVKESLKDKLTKENIVLVDDKLQLAGGAVEIYKMASSHSDQNLLVYVPHAKVLFAADHFSTDLKSALPNADKGTLKLRKKIEELQLKVKYFLGAHGSRILTLSDLKKVTDDYSVGTCPLSFAVCRN